MKVRYRGRLYPIYHLWASIRGFPDSSVGKESIPAMQETPV